MDRTWPAFMLRHLQLDILRSSTTACSIRTEVAKCQLKSADASPVLTGPGVQTLDPGDRTLKRHGKLSLSSRVRSSSSGCSTPCFTLEKSTVRVDDQGFANSP